MSRFRSQDDGSGKGHFSTITEGEKAQEVFTSGGHKYLHKTVNFQRSTGLEVVLCMAFIELCESTEVQKDCSEEKFGIRDCKVRMRSATKDKPVPPIQDLIKQSIQT